MWIKRIGVKTLCLEPRELVGMHLADQLLIPLALAGEGVLCTGALTGHTMTNLRVIEQFGGHCFSVAEEGPGRNVVSIA